MQPSDNVEFLGINWVGLTSENGRKLVVSLIFIAIIFIVNRILRALISSPRLGGPHKGLLAQFWGHQIRGLLTASIVILGVLSIWVNDATSLTSIVGILSAALVFALQQLVTAVAGYFVILFGKNFTVGDRISMGGVRGDVVGLGFTQTTIMEMGQPPGVQPSDPSVWVRSRQFTGRIVTVSNSQIFKEPVFNYTRDIPFIWEEMLIPVPYDANTGKAEEIILAAAHSHGYDFSRIPRETMNTFVEQFNVNEEDLKPRVFFRITDNWIELSLRFVVDAHSVREAKDSISRQILKELDSSGIRVASSTYEIVGAPPLKVETAEGK